MLIKAYDLSTVNSKPLDNGEVVYNVHSPYAAGGDLIFACLDEESAHALARSIDGNTRGYWKRET